MQYKPSKKKIAFAGPWITAKEVRYVKDAVTDGFYDSFHKHVHKLEHAICERTGARYSIATHCCTHALHLACATLGLTSGDEVICTDFSWIATAYAILYTGATPVFVDIDPDTWCIDPQAIVKAITKRTKAIMVVHSLGHPARMDEIMEIAQQHSLRVIEDAAPALGSTYNNIPVGTFGDIGCFSFQGAKIAVSGEGGIFVTNDEALYKKAACLCQMGRTDRVKKFWSDSIGFQYGMANLTAALALAQVERLDELVENKRRIYSWYHERLQSFPKVRLLVEQDSCFSNYSYPSLLLTPDVEERRDRVITELAALNIHCRPAFPRMSQFPAFSQPPRFSNPVASMVENRGISLPSAHNMTRRDVSFVCDALEMCLS